MPPTIRRQFGVVLLNFMWAFVKITAVKGRDLIFFGFGDRQARAYVALAYNRPLLV